MAPPVRLRRLAATLLAGLLLLLAPSAAQATTPTPVTSPNWQACTVRLDGIRSRVGARQRTVTIVNQTSRTYARVSFWVRTDARCSFTRKFWTRTARLGWNGTVAGNRRRQGSGTTPRGTYTMTESFGNGPAPRTRMPYHQVRRDDYWVGDNRSRHYNTLRSRAQGGFRWWLRNDRNSSEHLRSYGAQYRYVVVINFNRPPDRRRAYRGYGIFLHVKDGHTAGCVGITKRQMRTVLAYLTPGDKITIGRVSAPAARQS